MDEMETSVYGSTLLITGLKRGDTTYRVTLDKSIKDQFNQTLDRDLTFTFKVGPSPRRFVAPTKSFIVMDPAAPTRCSVFSVNYTRLKVRIYSVTPDDWPKWIAYKNSEEIEQHDYAARTPGRFQNHSYTDCSNDIVETVIDLQSGTYKRSWPDDSHRRTIRRRATIDEDDEDLTTLNPGSR